MLSLEKNIWLVTKKGNFQFVREQFVIKEEEEQKQLINEHVLLLVDHTKLHRMATVIIIQATGIITRLIAPCDSTL